MSAFMYSCMCVSSAAFGTPVVPEVNTIAAVSPVSVGQRAAGRAGLTHSSSNRGAPPDHVYGADAGVGGALGRLTGGTRPGDERAGPCVTQAVGHFAGLEQRVQRHDDAAGLEHAEVGDEELGDIGQLQADGLPGPTPTRASPSANGRRRVQLGVGQPAAVVQRHRLVGVRQGRLAKHGGEVQAHFGLSPSPRPITRRYGVALHRTSPPWRRTGPGFGQPQSPISRTSIHFRAIDGPRSSSEAQTATVTALSEWRLASDETLVSLPTRARPGVDCGGRRVSNRALGL